MTFEQTMHTISVLMSFPSVDSEELEPQIQALQGEYDRLRERNIHLLYELNTQKEINENLVARNNQLLVENAELKKRIEELE